MICLIILATARLATKHAMFVDYVACMCSSAIRSIEAEDALFGYPLLLIVLYLHCFALTGHITYW